MNDFLKTTLASVIGIMLALGILFTIFASYLASEPEPEISSSCVLVIDETLLTSEAGSMPSLMGWMTEQEQASLPLRKVIEGIRTAATDGRIRAILLLNEGQYHGMTARKELQSALLEFRAANKPIYAYASDYSQSGYYLSSVADPVIMPPLGIFDMKGLAAEVEYYATIMESVGIEMQVTRVGKYKSAVEPFLLSESSEANREQMMAILNGLQSTFLADVGQARGISEETLQAIVQTQGLLSAPQALEAGLIDKVAYFDELLAELQDLVGGGNDHEAFAQVGLFRYLEEMDAPDDAQNGPTIGVIYAEGEIVDGFSEAGIGGDRLAAQLRSARFDSNIDGIVLRVNSPGGSASASEVILREMQLMKQAGKPVVVSMGPVAASGGYWISCHADAILAQPNTITGSIGVFGMFPNIEGLLDEVGVKVEIFKTGPNADLFSLYNHKSDAQMAVMQGYVDNIYEGFLDRVAEGRGLHRDFVHEIAQGRVWTGARALELGLIDELGDLDAAIEKCASLIGTEEWQLDFLEDEAEGIDLFLESILEPEDYPVVDLGMPKEVLSLWKGLKTFRGYAQRPGVYARLPFNLNIH
ncbi:MAG: signal peptide peptidase SppA [Planctomycetota bacterium]|nr:MAG: signal peptide peptidase SppA [Planctomycetota bacterium]